MSKFNKLKETNKAPLGALDLIDETNNNEPKPENKNNKKNDTVKTNKVKRSFMLTNEQIRMLNIAKLNHDDISLTLSDIVGMAIENYCK